MKEEEKLVKAKEKLCFIIKKYGSLEFLRKERNEGNKKAATDEQKINRLKKKIQSIEESNGILKDKEKCEEMKYSKQT